VGGAVLEQSGVDTFCGFNDDSLFVAVVTRDVSVRAGLAAQLPGESVLLLFPDHATAAKTLGDGRLAADSGPGRGAAEVIVFGGLLIDPMRLDVTWRGAPLRLTRLERLVLARLAEPPARAWSYERLYSAAWGETWLGDTSALHATVKRLRRKLRDAGVTVLLESVRGFGFRLQPEPRHEPRGWPHRVHQRVGPSATGRAHPRGAASQVTASNS
jgi:two-component system response regulator MtrA